MYRTMQALTAIRMLLLRLQIIIHHSDANNTRVALVAASSMADGFNPIVHLIQTAVINTKRGISRQSAVYSGQSAVKMKSGKTADWKLPTENCRLKIANWMKPTSPWLRILWITFVLALPAVILYSLFTKVIKCPACYLFEDGSDGLKNYYTLDYYVKHDNGWHYTGMNLSLIHISEPTRPY